MEATKVEVRTLTARYRDAYARLRVGDIAGLTEVDLAVRGADRPLAAAIEGLVRGVDARAGAARASADGEEIDAGTQAARLRDAAMAATLIVLGLLYLSSARASSARLESTRRARDEALMQARESAEQASQLKSQFVAHMSHEIRTPLNAIVGLSQLALGTVTSPREREYFRTIDASARALLRIINDVLDLAKIEAGRLDLEAGPVDLDALLEDVSAVVAIAAEQKGIELLFAIDPRVAPTLVGDRMRLSQVLVNLASNGIKFTDSGEVEVSVSVVTTGPDRTKLRFAVRDTGIGLDSAARSRLFLPFSQGDASTTRRYAGTGLGLAISKELVGRMGGHLEVTSEPAAGSTFFFEIELGVAPPTPVKGGPTLEALRGLRVLVVDDSRTSRQILERALTALAFDVVCVESGEEAVAAAAAAKAPQRAFDIVMVDWKMPEMDGLETARRIVAGASPDRRPLVLMVTAYRMEEIRSEAEKVGFDAFLAKPVSRSALVVAIVEAHGKRTGKLGISGPPARAAAAALRGLRVLVAEDNAINQQVIRAILESAGVVVEVVPDGQRALGAVRADPFAVRGGAHGRADAGDGRPRGDAGDPRPGAGRAADPGRDRARLRGRARRLHRGGDGRAHRQARGARPSLRRPRQVGARLARSRARGGRRGRAAGGRRDRLGEPGGARRRRSLAGRVARGPDARGARLGRADLARAPLARRRRRRGPDRSHPARQRGQPVGRRCRPPGRRAGIAAHVGPCRCFGAPRGARARAGGRLRGALISRIAAVRRRTTS